VPQHNTTGAAGKENGNVIEDTYLLAAICLFRSRLLSRTTKIILYKTLIRPVVSYGAEAWTLTNKEEQAILISGRKIFRRMYGPKYGNGNGKAGRIES
jgi:hypothetical protein